MVYSSPSSRWTIAVPRPPTAPVIRTCPCGSFFISAPLDSISPLFLDICLRAQRAEKGADLLDQPLWFFHRREVPPCGHHRPPLKVVIALGPPARQQEYLLEEHGDASRCLDHGCASM